MELTLKKTSSEVFLFTGIILTKDDECMLEKFSPYFFKKLDAYQEFLRQEKRNRGPWEIEKMILKWCGSKHEHLGSSLKYIDITIMVKEHGYSIDEIVPAIGNLEAKGLVKSESQEDIDHFTSEGILMGEVIQSIENKFTRFIYYCTLLAFKILIPVSLVIVFLTLANQSIDFFHKFWK